jgi:putative acetyltransferase
VRIRPEQPRDLAAIRALVYQAFLDDPHREPGTPPIEHEIVDRLRARGALALSLVAEVDGEVIGHIAFSPVRVDGADVGWFGLGPVAVHPDRQGQGAGRALIEEGLARLRARGGGGVVLVGEPALYGRFGFRADARLTYEGVPPQYFLVLPLGDLVPRGAVSYDDAFSG